MIWRWLANRVLPKGWTKGIGHVPIIDPIEWLRVARFVQNELLNRWISRAYDPSTYFTMKP